MTVDEALWESCPSQPGTARTAWVLDQVRAKRLEYTWADLRVELRGTRALFRVTADAIKVGGVRLPVTALEQQQVADMLDASLLTPQLADARYAQRAVTVPPQTRNPMGHPPGAMSTPAWSIEVSQTIDKILTGTMLRDNDIVETVGKHWCLARACTTQRAVNYGLHGTSPPYACATQLAGPDIRVWQPASTRHDTHHSDYSQVCILLDNRCWVDGVPYDVRALFQHPQLHFLVSHEGPLPFVRQPGVDTLSVLYLPLDHPVTVAT